MKIRLILFSLVGIAAYIMLANFNSKMIHDNPVPEKHSQVSLPQPHPGHDTVSEKPIKNLPAAPGTTAIPQPIAPPTAVPQENPDAQPETTALPKMSEQSDKQQSMQAPSGEMEGRQQLQVELGQKEQQIRQLLDAQEAVAAKNRALLILLDAGTADVSAKDKMLREADGQIKALAADKKTATTELERARTDIAQLQAALKKIEAVGTQTEQLVQEKENRITTIQQQIQERNSEADRLKAQLAETDALLQTAKENLGQAEHKAHSLLLLDQEKEKQMIALQEKQHVLEASVQDKTAALNEALHTIQSLNQEVAAHPQALASMQNMLDERNRAFEQLQEESSTQIEQLSKQVTDLNKRDKQTTADVNRFKSAADTAQKKVAELESALAPAHASLQEAEKQLAAAQSSKDALQHQLNDRETATSSLQGQVSELLAKTTTLNDEKIGLASQLEALQADQKNLQVHKTSLEEKSAALASAETRLKDLAALQAKNEEMTKSLEEKTSALATATKQGEELTAVQAQLAEQQSKNKELSAQGEASASTIKQLEAEKSGLAGLLATTQGEASETAALKKSLAEKSSALNQAETKLKDLGNADEQIATLQAKLKENTDTQQALQAARQTAEQKAAATESTLKSLNQSLTASNDKEKTLATELTAAQVRIKELMDKNSLQQQLDLVPNLNQQIETLRSQVNQMAATDAQARKNLAETTEALQAKAEAIQTAEKKMQALQVENDALQKQLDTLKKPAQPSSIQQSSGNSTTGSVQDRDKDGIADTVDLCPNSPAGAPVNALGCPEKKGIILDGVNFKSNTAILLPDALKTLDRVVTSLTQVPQVRGEIAGYTDSVGDPKHNLELSTQRAQAVVKYLVDKGIATERLSAKGYGQEKPIADNATSTGKQQNRRVELYPLGP